MSRVLGLADCHFGHKNICKYRPQFKTPAEHDQHIIDNYMKTVRKRDTVYFLGDICFTIESLESIRALPGHKILIMGNHDAERYDTKLLFDVFNKVLSLKTWKGSWLTHCPIHADELRGKTCIHGHTHNYTIDDPNYRCISMEQIEYTPIDMTTIFPR